MKVEILILAAGKSSRMNGKNKLLAPVGALTLFERVITESLNSSATQVSVMLHPKVLRLWEISRNYPINLLSPQTKKIDRIISRNFP